MSVYDIPTRHEFYIADDPQYPILIPTQAHEVVRTEVVRNPLRFEAEEIVFMHYIKPL